jgi:hypothetical protein
MFSNADVVNTYWLGDHHKGDDFSVKITLLTGNIWPNQQQILPLVLALYNDMTLWHTTNTSAFAHGRVIFEDAHKMFSHFVVPADMRPHLEHQLRAIYTTADKNSPIRAHYHLRVGSLIIEVLADPAPLAGAIAAETLYQRFRFFSTPAFDRIMSRNTLPPFVAIIPLPNLVDTSQAFIILSDSPLASDSPLIDDRNAPQFMEVNLPMLRCPMHRLP